jgi:AcrR family transcriptional regulator
VAIQDEPRARRATTPAQRRQRNREEMVESILGAARAVMREQGVAALNLHEVARRVGIRAPSLYEYFPNRAAMYDVLFRLGLGLFAQHRDQALEGKTDAWDRLEASIVSYMTFAQESPELWYLLFERPVPGFTPSERSMDESRAMLGTATSYVEEAMTSGAMVPGIPAEQVRDFVIAVMHGLAASHEANEPHLPVGTGRFGSLIPVAMQVLQAAWRPKDGSPLPIKSRDSEKARDQL